MDLRLLLFSAILLFYLSLKGQSFQDCTNPFPICNLSTYHFEEMKGHGEYLDILPELRCISNQRFKETNSKWLFFEVRESGTLVFNIESMEEGDDLDFVLFEMNEDCSDLEDVRCMASGKNLINKRNTRSDCIGNTGLSYNSLDEFEKSGCKYSDNNFLKYLAVEQDEKYVLLVNNYDSENGFSISLNGDCKLRNAENCTSADLNLIIVNLYPNPTSESVVAEFNSIESSYTIQILDPTGKVFYEDTGSSEKGVHTLSIDVSPLLSGMYILRVSQSDLNTSRTFVK